MKKSLGHRVLVVGLLASFIASPAWALITVTVNPAANSFRTKTQPVQGHGTFTLTPGDDITNWNWNFAFGTKMPYTGMFVAENDAWFVPTGTIGWAKALTAPPWSVSPVAPPPMIPIPIGDHWARLTQEWALNPLGPTYVHETGNHVVTN